MGMKMENIITTVIWTVIGAVVIGVVGSLIYFRSKKSLIEKLDLNIFAANAKNVDLLKFQDVVAFFKESKRFAMLNANKNILPVVLREKNADGTYIVIAGLFDEKKDDMVDIENSSISYKVKSMDSELSGHFGDKDLVILR